MKIHMHDPSTQKAEQEVPKFSLDCIVKSRPAWATQQDSISKTNKQNH